MRLLFAVVLLLLTATQAVKLSGPLSALLQTRGGSSGGVSSSSSTGGGGGGLDDDRKIEISGSSLSKLNGIYVQTDWDINGRSHYERSVPGDKKIHLYWTGSQWNLHYDLDPSRSFDNLLAYAKVRVADPRRSSPYWHVREGKSYKQASLVLDRPGASSSSGSSSSINSINSDELMGVPKPLLPLYLAFMMDAIAVGLAMPLLPFFVMELGANALQLSMVVSANYIAQMIGCVVMGQVSDKYGRKPVLFICLAASFSSYFCVSSAKTLVGVALARIIVGSFGGLVPIMQSCVADVSSQEDRPKYLGRIMATFGMGIVLGPALSALIPGMSTREKIRFASLLPLGGLAIALLFFKETKDFHLHNDKGREAASKKIRVSSSTTAVKLKRVEQKPPVSLNVLLLVLNGFLLMYAFATETIYAMFIKDSFGYGERDLSTIFAASGFFIGVFQVFFIKPLINRIGKHATLACGNIILALGMVGIALIRNKVFHFALFGAHVVGYSIADTALASLISRYSPPSTQGRDLALNQAAQSCARVLSPLFAGMLYEQSKRAGVLPVGALPFLAGALMPALGVFVSSLLYVRSVATKRKETTKKA